MSSESVRVMVRARPLNTREKAQQSSTVVEIDSDNMQIILTKPNEAETQKVFSYDAVFPPDVKQQTVYEQAAFPLVESVINGYNGTIFAYGQTGCGKTHTMLGNSDDESNKGIIPRAFAHIFGNIESTEQKNFLIRCSYIEIYNEEIRDLLGPDPNAKMELKESTDKGVFIKNLSTLVVKSIAEIERYMALGSKNRHTAETAMNKDSSRSHSIFTIYIESSETNQKGNQTLKLGKLNLVDLAGSERQSRTGATGDRLKEANKINLSLSALGNVISALVDGKSSHVPYRDSKLTRLLQDSLGGNTKTVMIANVSCASDSYDETLGTLRYASRAKNIKNKPRVNEDPKDAMLREYADEIKRLKAMLEGGGAQIMMNNENRVENNDVKGNRNESALGHVLKAKEEEIEDERRKREELERKLKEMEENLVKGGGQKQDVEDEPEEKKKYQEMLNRLQEQEEMHEELIREKEKREEEALMAEKKYSSLQEEVLEQRQTIKKLRKKYQAAKREIEDLEREHEFEKEDLLESIRALEKEVRINDAIMMYVLKPSDLSKVRATAHWREDIDEYVVAPFLIREKRVQFPKLSQQKVLEIINEEWKDRELEFEGIKNYNKYKKLSAVDYQFDDSPASFTEDHIPSHFPPKKVLDETMARNNRTGFFKNENKLPTLKQNMAANAGRGDVFMKENVPNYGFEPRHRHVDSIDKSRISTSDTLKESLYEELKPFQDNMSKKGNVSRFNRKIKYKNVQLEPINQEELTRGTLEDISNREERHRIAQLDALPGVKDPSNFKRKVTLKPLSHEPDVLQKSKMPFRPNAFKLREE